ncbi:MAG: hypothetical protein GY822_19770 [Deltaproteobacteria bacterium]|nr:hypothetical protein [Deltaproteobacteria bacterium]
MSPSKNSPLLDKNEIDAPLSTDEPENKASFPWYFRIWTEWLRLLSLKEKGTTLALFRMAVATVVAGLPFGNGLF